MNIQEFKQILLQKAAELNDFRHRKLPVLVGRTAKDHFQENFRQGGFCRRFPSSLAGSSKTEKRREKSFRQIRYAAFRQKPPVQLYQIYSGRLQRHRDKRRGIRSVTQ